MGKSSKPKANRDGSKKKTGNISSKKLKLAVKEFYFNETDVSEICNLLPVPQSTVYSWIASEGWDKQKDSRLQLYINAPEVLLNLLFESIEALKDKDKIEPTDLVKASDSISKIVKSFKTLCQDKDRFSQILFVVRDIGRFMNEQDDMTLYDEDFREKFVKLLTGYQIKAVEKYSNKN